MVKSDFLVATNRRAIVATIEILLDRYFLSKQKLQILSRQLSQQKSPVANVAGILRFL
jgi:hypothetical protein